MCEKIDAIKKSIVEELQEKGFINFIRLEDIFDENSFEYRGDREIYDALQPQILFWSGWNEEAISLLHSLIDEQVFSLGKCPSTDFFDVSAKKLTRIFEAFFVAITKSSRCSRGQGMAFYPPEFVTFEMCPYSYCNECPHLKCCMHP